MKLADGSINKDQLLAARRSGELEFSLFTLAVSNIQKSLPQGSTTLFIAPVERVMQMHAASIRHATFLTPPSKRGSKSSPWIDQVDIFDLEKLVLPFAIVNSTTKEREYHVVSVDMTKHVIHILSPRHRSRRYNILLEVSNIYHSSSDCSNACVLLLGLSRECRRC